jgi:hypothetical protein
MFGVIAAVRGAAGNINDDAAAVPLVMQDRLPAQVRQGSCYWRSANRLLAVG